MEFQPVPFQKFINTIEAPVLVADIQGNIQSANVNATKAVHKFLHEIRGKPGGEVMDCVYADLPEGCGKTEHCSGCTIRNTVMKTHTTGQAQPYVADYQMLKQPHGPQKMQIIISTEKVGHFVLLRMNEMAVA